MLKRLRQDLEIAKNTDADDANARKFEGKEKRESSEVVFSHYSTRGINGYEINANSTVQTTAEFDDSDDPILSGSIPGRLVKRTSDEEATKGKSDRLELPSPSKDFPSSSRDEEAPSFVTDEERRRRVNGDEKEDPDAMLRRELMRIKRERESAKARGEAAFTTATVPSIARALDESGVKRRWDEDVIFRVDAAAAFEDKKKEFVNDSVHSEFHRRFLKKYVR